jgi:hypothetical protein
MDKSFEEKGEKPISRAYFLNTNDSLFGTPAEVQIAIPKYQDQNDETFVSHMINLDSYPLPQKIKMLDVKYIYKEEKTKDKLTNNLFVGIQWSDLKELVLAYNALPSIWGVSGPRESGKTNFLNLVINQMALPSGDYQLELFSFFPSYLTSLCAKVGHHVTCGNEAILKRLKEILPDQIRSTQKRQLIVLDDIHLFWEQDSEINKGIKESLETLSRMIYGRQSVMVIASFNYSPQLKIAKNRDKFIKDLHDNKTGMCLGYEDDWLINSTDVANYKKKIGIVAPSGRGIFVLKGKETEIQAYWHKVEL